MHKNDLFIKAMLNFKTQSIEEWEKAFKYIEISLNVINLKLKLKVVTFFPVPLKCIKMIYLLKRC